jgi:Ca-activated chloride channel family protein
MVFEQPLWLFGLLLLPVIAGLEAILRRRDRERTARLVARPLWVRVLGRTRERWRYLRLALLLAGAAGIVLALARPQWGIVREKVEREGVDVVLALDTSGSMATEDVPPNRFFLARAALSSLVSRLEGDRFGLLAFEGEAYPLVPITLDADAVGLFLETVEPGIVPAPGSSLGLGLEKGLAMFVDEARRNRVMVLVSDGEDLEGDVEGAVQRAKAAGVVVHTVGVGTEGGQPVPDFDREGRRVGFKKDEQGGAVVSRLNAQTLEAIARGTGGQFFRITSADTSLSGLAAAIEGLEHKTLAKEFSYRRKERFQVPLAAGLGALAVGLLLPWQSRRMAAVLALLLLPVPARAQSPSPAAPKPEAPPASAPQPGALDEVLLRPRRFAAEGKAEYDKGNHPAALQSFEQAAAVRPQDPRARFNVADGLYKNGKYPEAGTLYKALGQDPKSPVALPSRFNLGNTLFQQQDYKGAIGAYRDALRLSPGDPDTLKNLELSLRELQKQEEQRKKDQQKDQKNQDQKDKDKNQNDSANSDKKPSPSPGQDKPGQDKAPRPQTAEEKEQQRFKDETGMPKERAMQLLEALQQNEKAEQKKLLEAQRAKKKKGKDW